MQIAESDLKDIYGNPVGEDVRLVNFSVLKVRPVLLVSNFSGLSNAASLLEDEGFTVTHATDEIANGYPVLTDLDFLSQFSMVIYSERGGNTDDGHELPQNVADVLEAYIQQGGDLLVTGNDVLYPSDNAMAQLLRSVTGNSFAAKVISAWETRDIDHPILNGFYGDVRGKSFNIEPLDSDSFFVDDSKGTLVLVDSPESDQPQIVITPIEGGGSVGYWDGGLRGTNNDAQLGFIDGEDRETIFLNWVTFAAID